MSLFQKNVVTKYLQAQDKNLLEQKWNDFRSHFHNVTIQENIRNSKEEQYQEGFLRDLFVRIFGYTLNPDTDFNLTTELKNVKDSKKADGAIIINEKVKAVIELKGTNTTDLGKIEAQAFGYKNNQKDCTYVVTSNFEKIRFYIENTIEFIEFNLFTLTKQDFDLLYLCLAYRNIKEDIAQKIKNESVSQEDVITKKLYKDYSLFKRELYNNLVQLNPEFEPLELFKKSQKLLDRFLFIFFAEDRNLLPTNLIFRINAEWKQLKEMRIEVSIYDRYKMYFNDLNTGAKVSLPAFSQSSGVSKEEHQIFAYNGGLFAEDELLNSLKIDDDLLYNHTEKLSHYDFASEVDVNILGHIFENSLNEIDEIKAQIEGQEIDKSKTKRKKDGVFYTPKYITKYIVENTVGKLCEEKKAELLIKEEDYFSDKKRTKTTKQPLLEKLNLYRNWLLQLTICDPACGSGAFLNQALDFLIEEHRYIDELQAKLFGDTLVLSDIEQSILENNLFGVDLNEESVQIARLSLWLRTAQPNRRLNDLSNNIKCGNSLIDDPEIAGEKAFDWEKEFPQVFEKGGFDVIIGNPPYGVNFDEQTKSYLTKFDSLVPDFEIYIYFISLYKKILRENGILSYIFPNTFLSTLFGKNYREEIFSKVSVNEIVDLSNDNTFVDASVRTIIFSFTKNETNYTTDFLKVENKDFQFIEKYNKSEILQEIENVFSLFNQSKSEKIIIEKIRNNKSLSDFYEVSQGLIPYDKYRGHDEFTIKNRIWHSDFKKDDTYKKELKGGDVNAYSVIWNENLWISYGNWLAAPRESKFFTKERILIREITNDKLQCGYTDLEFYNTPSLINIIDEKSILNLKFTLAILNSNLIGWYHNKTSPKANKGLFPKILVNDVRKLPIKNIPLSSQQPFIEKADLMLSLNRDLQELNGKFQRTIQREFSLEKLSKKLENWSDLSYADFLKELTKLKVILSLSQKSEWEDYFNQEQQKAQTIKNKINSTDQEIDKMVYKLYDLTQEEIEIVEQA